MRKKNKKYLLVLIPLFLIVFFLPESPVSNLGSEGIEFITEGSYFTLSFFGTPNFAVECDIKDKLQVFVVERGEFVQVANYEITQRPLLALVNRNTGEEITEWKNQVVINCDWNNSLIDSMTVEGKITFAISLPEPNSSTDRLIKVTTATINTKTLRDNSDRNMVSLLFDSADVEDLLRVNRNDHGWVKVIMTPDLVFTQTLHDGSKQESTIGNEATLSTKYLIERTREQPPTASLGTEVRIESFTPKSFQLPLSSPQRFITVIGAVDNYSPSEGKPYIKLIQPSGVKSTQFLMNELSNPTGDKWTNFKVTVQLPPNPAVGKWKIEMDSPAAQRGISTRDFNILEESFDGDVDEGNDKSDEGGGSTATGINLNGVVQYRILYQGNDIQSNILELEKASTSQFLFQPQSLVDDFERPTRTDAKLSSIRLDATLLDVGKLRFISSDLKYDTTVTADGKTGKLTELDTRETTVGSIIDCYRKNTSGDCVNGIQISFTQILTNEIEDQLKALKVTPKGNDRIPVELETNINGLVTLVNPTGQRYTANIQDLVFKYETHYALASSLDSDNDGIADDGSSIDDDDSSSGCVDFFGLEIGCDVTDETDSNDNLVNDIIDGILGGPDDEAGSNKPTVCAGIEGHDPNCERTFDDTTIILIVIGLILIMVVVIWFSRRKRF